MYQWRRVHRHQNDVTPVDHRHHCRRRHVIADQADHGLDRVPGHVHVREVRDGEDREIIAEGGVRHGHDLDRGRRCRGHRQRAGHFHHYQPVLGELDRQKCV